MSVDEMIACLGSCRARSEIAAMIEALSLHPSLNTLVEAKRLRPPAPRWRAGSPTATPAKPGTTRAACASAPLKRIEDGPVTGPGLVIGRGEGLRSPADKKSQLRIALAVPQHTNSKTTHLSLG